MADRGVSIEKIARLNDRTPEYVREYIRRRGEAIRGGPAPISPRLHDRPRPRPARLPDPDRRWRARLEELDTFLTAHQRRPRATRGDSDRRAGSEWSLAHWLTTQRSHDRKGSLAIHRARELDRVLPSWRVDSRSLEYESAWRLKLAEMVKFIELHGRKLAGVERLVWRRRACASGWRHSSERPVTGCWILRGVPGWIGRSPAGGRDYLVGRKAAEARARQVVESVKLTMSLEGQDLSPEAIERIYEKILRTELEKP